MSTETKVDLHGIEKQPFPSFDEGTTYLERVTVPDVLDARRLISAEYARSMDEVEVEPIYMRWIDWNSTLNNPPKLTELPGWYECPEDDWGATPFWREVV